MNKLFYTYNQIYKYILKSSYSPCELIQKVFHVYIEFKLMLPLKIFAHTHK